ncbi:hypothetical protein N7462_010160 [Penicillium macrosclerotiorum]|uniref:uncharacterized protein n=1 Tax=Penicillium macrosclerotiorum TaxID=303699 RepID=UPI002547A013|nr:uncharacterized protein N7462_010160 [Penicillium macrosclerotiorum]KAJ5669090.1 hypothetical protein N7462_010160 [Penicillium macrosclerotiorum]
MSLPNPWIANLVKRCLASYLGHTQENDVEVEDDGACLSFGIHDSTLTALIADWGLGSSCDSGVLMESSNQIDAIFPHDSIENAKAQSRTLYSKESSLMKQRIELLSFNLIFPYSTSAPTFDVCLRVNRFRINWGEEKKFKPSKKLKNDKAVRGLLEQAQRKAKDASRAFKPIEAVRSPSRISDPSHGNSPGTRTTEISFPHGGESQQFFSQVPNYERDTLQHNPIGVNHPVSRASATLLQHLASSSRPNSRNVSLSSPSPQIQADEMAAKRDPLQMLVGGESIANGAHKLLPMGNEHVREDSISSQPEKENTSSHLEKDYTPEALNEHNRSPSRKRNRESMEFQSQRTIEETHNSQHAPDSLTVSPSRKRQRTDASSPKLPDPREPESLPVQVTRVPDPQALIDASKSVADDPSPPTDPWNGLSKISDRDVEILKSQADLLDGILCWIPPLPGDLMPQGHVPPQLLKQWNEIATLRHHQQAEDKAILERPVTPTQDIISSAGSEDGTLGNESPGREFSWSASPVDTHAQNVLPPSSPVKETRRDSTPHWGEANVRRDGNAGDLENRKSPRDMPQKEKDTAVSSSQASLSVSRDSISAEYDKRNPVEIPLCPVENGQGEPMCHGKQRSPSLEAPGIDSQFQYLSTKRPVHLSSPRSIAECHDVIIEESDDESVMDTSVPIALGESLPPTQCSQTGQEVTQSGISLTKRNMGHVQVAVTPIIDINKAYREDPNKQQSQLDSSKLPFDSSQVQKGSSQSRILNTDPYLGSYERDHSSHEIIDSSSSQSEDIVKRQTEVAVPQTQSSMNSHMPSYSQGVPSHSQHDIVLDSSEAAQRHHDLLLPHQDSQIEPFTQQLESSYAPDSPLLNESILAHAQRESPSGPEPSPQVLGLEHRYHSCNEQDCSPSGSPKGTSQTPQNNANQALPATSAELVARRLGFIHDPTTSVEAQKVYKKFCNDYPRYIGDYRHFTELCSKLQAVRDRGQLQRSNLWDDFIILHLDSDVGYVSYFAECRSQGYADLLSYEEYFLTNVLQSVNKKRSLSAHDIEVAASQSTLQDTASPITSNLLPSASSATEAQTSNAFLPSGFVGRFPQTHASSFRVNTGHELLREGESIFAPTALESSGSSVIIKQESQDTEFRDTIINETVPTSSLDIKPILSNDSIAVSQHLSIETQITSTQDEQNISNGGIEGLDAEEVDAEETDAEDTRHETASIELGDESFISNATSAPGDDEIPETESETEPEEENWFLSLRRMYPSGPVWSDSPDTPFKRWGQADQNVLSERQRRGGAKILLDEKGVIRRPIHR